MVKESRKLLRENLRVAFDTLRSRKMRSFLTILGIVIGVTSVISVAAIIEGLNGFIQKRVENLGSRVLFVSRIPFATFGKISEKVRLRKYLEYGDAAYLRETCPSLSNATAFGNRISFDTGPNEIRYGAERVERFFLRGAEPDYTNAIPLFTVGQGRFVSNFDQEHARAVAVLGRGIADTLFPSTDPLGKQVRINGQLYEVIGVFEKDEGLFGGFGVDQFVIIPYSNFHKNYPQVREVFLAVSVRSDAEMGVAENEVIEAMRRRRRVPHSGENDFEVGTPDFLSNIWNQLTGALAILTGVISSIGLLIGGIGVMNIMLISVTERTREIGIRKAIGATKNDIRAQFLFEAITLSLLGGAIGITCGAIIAFAVRTLVPSIPASLSLLWIFLGVAISLGVGLFFGYYPADRAANLDPIVALRYE